MKRLFSLLLAAVLLFSLPPAAWAADSSEPLEANNTIPGSFSAAGEVLRYRLVLKEPGAIRIKLEGAVCSAQLFRIDAAGGSLPLRFQSPTPNGSAAVREDVPLPGQSTKIRVPAGQYELQLTGAAAGDFRLVLYHNPESGGNTEKESNDIPPDATPLSPGASIRGNAQSVIDDDYYFLRLPYAVTLQAKMTIPSGSRFYIQILNQDQGVLHRFTYEGSSSSGSALTLPAGQYYVRVYPSSNLALYSNDDYTLSLSLSQGPSSWAVPELTQAAALGLIPEGLQGNYTSPITRQEFCKLVNTLLTARTGKSMNQLLSDRDVTVNPSVFADTNDSDVLAANALGIVKGRNAEKKLFAPNEKISRQEAAVMLCRAAAVLGVTEPNSTPLTFTDAIAGWAQREVSFVSGMIDPSTEKRVMQGTNAAAGTFSPTGSYTREMSVVTMVRLYGAIGPVD